VGKGFGTKQKRVQETCTEATFVIVLLLGYSAVAQLELGWLKKNKGTQKKH
jgi:hypothetical protein